MVGKIFISYRREDSAASALNIAQYVERHFGRRSVFLDVDIPSGSNFPRELERHLAQCKVLLAIIGPRWVDAQDERGNRRLENPEDWVRLEISRALERNIAVIPVIIEGAEIPKRSKLPEAIQGLLDRQTATVTTKTFRNDMAGLARDIRGHLTKKRRWKVFAGAAAITAIGAAAVLYELGPSTVIQWGSMGSELAFDISPENDLGIEHGLAIVKGSLGEYELFEGNNVWRKAPPEFFMGHYIATHCTNFCTVVGALDSDARIIIGGRLLTEISMVYFGKCLSTWRCGKVLVSIKHNRATLSTAELQHRRS